MPDIREHALADRPAGKPFPSDYARCGRKAVWPAFVPYRGQVRHDGRLHAVDLPRLIVPRYEACGEVYLDNRADDQIRLALRKQLQMLDSGQLRMNREALGFSRPEFAARLGVDEEALRRWEEEAALPPRVVDDLMRLYFAFPPVRSALGATPNPRLGVCVVSEAAATSTD